MNNTKNEIRISCIEKLNSVIKNKKISTKVEQSIFDHSCENFDISTSDIWSNKNFKRKYLNKMISIYSNLDKKSYIGNENLLAKIKKKDFNLDDIANLNPQSLYPEIWEEILQKKNAVDDFIYAKKGEIRTNQYFCGKCKNNDCSYYQIQIRSADEPMTTFVTCLVCNHKWKF